jgi:hypothetical protein
MPETELIAAMGAFNEKMAKAGVMLAGEGLHPSSRGSRVRFTRGTPLVTDGPFAETKELVSGFWMIQVDSKEEALRWATRAPFPEGAEIEVRQVFEITDFPADILPPAEAQRQEALRQELQRKSGSR